MSKKKSSGPEGTIQSILQSIFQPDSIGEFIFDGLLAAATLIVFPIIIVIKIVSLLN